MTFFELIKLRFQILKESIAFAKTSIEAMKVVFDFAKTVIGWFE